MYLANVNFMFNQPVVYPCLSMPSTKRELNMLIGQLFVEQTEVNLFSSILDTPDFLWDNDEQVRII